MSIFVITTMTGTLSASAIPRCSLRRVSVAGNPNAEDQHCLLAHANQSVICSHHEQAVVGTAAQQTEHGGSQIPFVACQICEADDFRL